MFISGSDRFEITVNYFSDFRGITSNILKKTEN